MIVAVVSVCRYVLDGSIVCWAGEVFDLGRRVMVVGICVIFERCGQDGFNGINLRGGVERLRVMSTG